MVKAVDLLFHLNEVDVPTTVVGLLAIALILLFDRTRLNKFSMLIGLLIVALLPIVFTGSRLRWSATRQVSLPGSPDLCFLFRFKPGSDHGWDCRGDHWHGAGRGGGTSAIPTRTGNIRMSRRISSARELPTSR